MPEQCNFEVTIRNKQEASETWVEVAIADTGGGIEAALLPHLFERFASGHQSAGLERIMHFQGGFNRTY